MYTCMCHINCSQTEQLRNALKYSWHVRILQQHCNNYMYMANDKINIEFA